ncbi:MAG: efflux RND transporter periplasmic adaptor subunit [Gemmatimonadota bacterium]|jgi:RND family efflux transporter MFP subunit
MNTRSQIILALSIVLLSAGAVTVYSMAQTPRESADSGMEGHDHSAMSSGGGDAQPVILDDEGARRIGVTFATVTRGSLPRTVRTVGFVTYDETRITSVSPKIEGWVEELFVNFTGAPVRAGQPLLEVYSPALVTAQEELLLAKRLLAQATESGGAQARDNAENLLSAARRRLAYWDIPQDLIQAIEEEGTVTKTMTLRAPAGGFVVEKDAVEGARIGPGMELFRLADLSRVWVDAEVFEKDLSLVRNGQHAMVGFEAYPGEMFHGSVTYVYPSVSAEARTGRVRIELQNPSLKLKPGMYAQVDLHGAAVEEALLIPRSALLQTGERSMVFHRMSNGQLHPMEVVTGLALGDQIQVLSGLREGQVVVASATFLIDAESNLGAAMAAMAGMDHSMTDHSQMDMGSEMDTGADMDMSGEEEMDHSQHQMGGTPPDTAGGR